MNTEVIDLILNAIMIIGLLVVWREIRRNR